jgi:hypothetical protein
MQSSAIVYDAEHTALVEVTQLRRHHLCVELLRILSRGSYRLSWACRAASWGGCGDGVGIQLGW